MPNFDATDIKILYHLQQHGGATAQELGEALHLSTSQAGRRRARLEAEGIIKGYGARLDPAVLGLNVQAFVQVQTSAHAPDTHQSFLRLANTQPQITAAWTMTGTADYMLRVFCEDLAALNRLVQDILLPHPAVERVTSQIVMDQFKRDAPLPT